MSQLQTLSSPAKSSHSGTKNSPFASALAAAEKNESKDSQPSNNSSIDDFRRALQNAQRGDASSKATVGHGMQNEDYFEHQKHSMLEQKRIDALREQQHAKVNPTERRDVYVARQQKDAAEIENLRGNIQALYPEVVAKEPEFYNTLNTQVIDTGENAKMYKIFYKWLQSQANKVQKLLSSSRNSAAWAAAAAGKKERGHQITASVQKDIQPGEGTNKQHSAG